MGSLESHVRGPGVGSLGSLRLGGPGVRSLGSLRIGGPGVGSLGYLRLGGPVVGSLESQVRGPWGGEPSEVHPG